MRERSRVENLLTPRGLMATTISGYTVNVYSVIGKSYPAIGSVQKVTGEARYTGDLSLPGLLHGKILRSPLPHARIGHIDPSRALKLAGVKAVATGRDTLGVKVGGLRGKAEWQDRQGICVDKVRYVGDVVAAVAAADEDTAEEALGLIEVEYEEIPAVFDPQEAMAPGAPRLHEPSERNVSLEIKVECGNVEEALSRAYYVREDVFTTQPVNHCYMEPRVATARVDSKGMVTVWSSTQAPYFVHHDLVTTLGCAEEDVRVIKPYVGGGFGGKLDGMDAADFCAAILSKLSGRPVRLTYGREEEFIASRRRHSTRVELRTGVDREGILLGRESKALFDGGAYNSLGQAACISGGTRQLLPYRLPNMRYHGIRVYTNKAPSGAMRGFGIPQVHFAIEVQLDMIADEIGLDPVDLRLRNALRTGDRNPKAFHILSSGLPECISAAADSINWKGKKGNLGFGRGMGISCSGFICGSPAQQFPSQSFSAARVQYNSDGTATVYTGAADVGQGSDTALVQIAAEELGLRFEDVGIVSADTGAAPPDQGTYASRVTMMAGNAVKRAAAQARRKLFEAAADKLEANTNDLEIMDRQLRVKGSPERSLLVLEAVKLAGASAGNSVVSGEGSYNPPDAAQRASPTFSFEAQAMEVGVDTSTGQIKVVNSVIAHDCGTVINPMAVEGQLEGSVVMGMGYALSERLLLEDGLTLNTSFVDYSMPTALDVPFIQGIAIDSGDPEGPYGAKEAGEGTLAPFAPALVNAVYNAIGVRIKDLPLTPERVLSALAKDRTGAQADGPARRRAVG